MFRVFRVQHEIPADIVAITCTKVCKNIYSQYNELLVQLQVTFNGLRLSLLHPTSMISSMYMYLIVLGLLPIDTGCASRRVNKRRDTNSPVASTYFIADCCNSQHALYFTAHLVVHDLSCGACSRVSDIIIGPVTRFCKFGDTLNNNFSFSFFLLAFELIDDELCCQLSLRWIPNSTAISRMKIYSMLASAHYKTIFL